MCLNIDNTIKNKKVDKNGFCLGWKLITKHNNFSPMYYPPMIFNVGINNSSRETTNLTAKEVEYQTINKGFHIFLDRQDARKTRSKYIEKIVKVFYRPEDVVALGTWTIGGMKEVVVTKLTIRSLDHVR